MSTNFPILVTDWAALPDALVVAVSERLPVVSAISMALACKSWRRVLSTSLPRGLPWFMFSGENYVETRTCFSLSETKSWELRIPQARNKYCWGSVQEWLIVAQISYSIELDISFHNPFSNSTIICPPKIIKYFYKIVLSASPAVQTCVYVLLHGSLRDIKCWVPGAPDWYYFNCPQKFDDAVYCNGLFYFITRDFNLWTLDENATYSRIKETVESNTSVHLQFGYLPVEMPDRPAQQTCWCSYLVESCGEVLLVLRLFDQSRCEVRPTLTFWVFKLDTRRKMWAKMESLGDRVLFIGNSDTRSFSAKELSNCICFFNDCVSPGYNEWTEQGFGSKPLMFEDWGVFSLDSNCIVTESFSNHFPNPPSWPPVWITAPIWWYCQHLLNLQ